MPTTPDLMILGTALHYEKETTLSAQTALQKINKSKTL
jgi:hypothetical protein